MMKYRALAVAAVALAAAAGCDNETRPRALCGPESVIAFDGDEWCIVIEEGFLTTDCPEDWPEGRGFGDVVVCGSDEAPDEMEGELRSRGYLHEECVDDAERGIVYVTDGPDCDASEVVCPEGDEAFRDDCGCGCRWLGDCEEGASREVDCNTCTCTDGSWQCTLLPCGECTDGDTVEPVACRSCTCIDGGWTCEDDTECLAAECVAACDACDGGSDEWRCAEDGQWYCGACEPECLGLAVVDDWSGCAECTEGDSREDGCGTCTCFEGRWICGADQWCQEERCLAECPTECLPADEQPCGDSTDRFCTACHMECYGVYEAEDVWCDDPASVACPSVPPEYTPVAWEAWTVGPECDVPYEVTGTALFESDDDLAAAYGCVSSSGIDWERYRLVRGVFPERVDAEIFEVLERTDELLIRLSAPPYCGGPAPPNAAVHALVPVASPTTLNQTICAYGRCYGPPAP